MKKEESKSNIAAKQKVIKNSERIKPAIDKKAEQPRYKTMFYGQKPNTAFVKKVTDANTPDFFKVKILAELAPILHDAQRLDDSEDRDSLDAKVAEINARLAGIRHKRKNLVPFKLDLQTEGDVDVVTVDYLPLINFNYVVKQKADKRYTIEKIALPSDKTLSRLLTTDQESKRFCYFAIGKTFYIIADTKTGGKHAQILSWLREPWFAEQYGQSIEQTAAMAGELKIRKDSETGRFAVFFNDVTGHFSLELGEKADSIPFFAPALLYQIGASMAKDDDHDKLFHKGLLFQPYKEVRTEAAAEQSAAASPAQANPANPGM